MRLTLRQVFISLVALVTAVLTGLFMLRNEALLGEESLLLRNLVLSCAIIAMLLAVYPFIPLFRNKPGRYLLFVCLPALLPGLVYYLYLLPQQAGEGVIAAQLQSELISDRSSNGIIEVGFSYPIYTPTIAVTNNELFTRRVNVFLRMIDANNETALFRAVRMRIPGAGLSVEATVRGMLSENPDYLFLPLVIPPLGTVEGKVVFIISNLDDGTTFTEAMGRAYQAQFELRDPETAELLVEFPLAFF